MQYVTVLVRECARMENAVACQFLLAVGIAQQMCASGLHILYAVVTEVSMRSVLCVLHLCLHEQPWFTPQHHRCVVLFAHVVIL